MGRERTVSNYVSEGKRMVEDKVRREDTEATASMRCEQCEGEGYVYQEYAVVDYVNGGWLEERRRTCPECEGSGIN